MADVQDRNEEIATLLRQRADALRTNPFPGFESANLIAARELDKVALYVQRGDTYEVETITGLRGRVADLVRRLDIAERQRDKLGGALRPRLEPSEWRAVLWEVGMMWREADDVIRSGGIPSQVIQDLADAYDTPSDEAPAPQPEPDEWPLLCNLDHSGEFIRIVERACEATHRCRRAEGYELGPEVTNA